MNTNYILGGLFAVSTVLAIYYAMQNKKLIEQTSKENSIANTYRRQLNAIWLGQTATASNDSTDIIQDAYAGLPPVQTGTGVFSTQ